MKDNEIEVTELSDLLRYIELQVKKSDLPITAKANIISNAQHLVKQGFDLGKNGVTYFEAGE